MKPPARSLILIRTVAAWTDAIITHHVCAIARTADAHRATIACPWLRTRRRTPAPGRKRKTRGSRSYLRRIGSAAGAKVVVTLRTVRQRASTSRFAHQSALRSDAFAGHCSSTRRIRRSPDGSSPAKKF
jgi:hypothetical protein